MNTEKTELKENEIIADVSSSLTQIPLFQYNAAVESHKNTLDLLEIMGNDIKELKLDLKAAYKEIERLKLKLIYH